MEQSFTPYSDQELLAFVQQKNEQAFNTLYHRYYLPLYKKAGLRLDSREVVEEVVQDVFVNLWQKAEDLDIHGNVRAYLYATLRNKILHELRTAYNRSIHIKKVRTIDDPPIQEKSLQLIYKKETEEKIESILAKLSPKCKQAFLLNRYEELSYAEVAERMQVSEKTVEKHIAKALKILRYSLSS